MIRLLNVGVMLEDNRELKEIAAKRLEISLDSIKSLDIVKETIDARRYKGSPIQIIYTLDVGLNIDEKNVLKKFKRDKNVSVAPIKSLENIFIKPFFFQRVPKTSNLKNFFCF